MPEPTAPPAETAETTAAIVPGDTPIYDALCTELGDPTETFEEASGEQQ